MTKHPSVKDPVFDVATPLGFRVHASRSRWEMISTIKHPVMAGREVSVRNALANPDQVRQSRRDPWVYLFYKREGRKRWVCAVVRQTGETGFLITAYPTDAIKEGTSAWQR
jgi:hypothetical protein